MPQFPSNNVLTGMVQAFKPDETMLAHSMFTTEKTKTDGYSFDIISGSRTLTDPANPDSVAKIQALTTRTRKAVKLLTFRDKKQLKESTLRWFQGPGSTIPEPAKKSLAREMEDLDRIQQRTWEYIMWQLLMTGVYTTGADAEEDLSYDFGLDHTTTVSTAWTGSTAVPLSDIAAAKQEVQQDSGYTAKTLILSSAGLRYLMQTTQALNILGESTKDQYARSGVIPVLADLKVAVFDSGYRDSSGVFKFFLSDDGVAGNMALIVADGELGEFTSGPTVDSKAPDGMVGKFAKSWVDEDPAGRWVLQTHTAMAGLTHPDKISALTLW